MDDKKPAPCFCGHDCARCLTYLATVNSDEELRKQSQRFYRDMLKLDIELPKLRCMGGRSKDAFYLCEGCPWMRCCAERELNSCAQCGEYPCEPLAAYREKYVNKCNQIPCDMS